MRQGTLTFVVLLALAAHSAAGTAQERAALWLTEQLHDSVLPSQLLRWPALATPESCAIVRVQAASTGLTALTLRCSELTLPQLALVALRSAAASPDRSAATAPRQQKAHLVHAGSRLRAELRTAAMHAELPVVALEAGESGEEIRVRVFGSARVLHARILGAHEVAIVGV
jgi:hypothetical protein